jgi:hydrogenase nickel incorporation protein HypA/HybF
VHEAKLCLSLIDIAEEQLRRAGGERILRLRVRVGAFSGVVPEALASAFPICSLGTRAEQAALELEAVPGRELVLNDMEVE